MMMLFLSETWLKPKESTIKRYVCLAVFILQKLHYTEFALDFCDKMEMSGIQLISLNNNCRLSNINPLVLAEEKSFRKFFL